MKKNLFKVGVAVITIGILWAFVGVERIVGDHEMGLSWEPFIKHRPSLQLRFQNPAQKGLEIEPFETLSAVEQAAFKEYCVSRFGTSDIMQCRSLIAQRRI